MSCRAGLLAALLSAAGPAHAYDFVRHEDGVTLEGQAFYKNFLMAMAPSPGLVKGSQALADLTEATRAMLPPEQAALIPASTPLPSFAGIDFNVARFGGKALWKDLLEFEAAWQISTTLASSPAFASGASLSGFVATGNSGPAKRRLWDFNPVLSATGSMLVQHDLDRLALKLNTSKATIVIGRQALSWGTGHLWNPTDLLSPFAPTAVDKEVRRGIDAVRASIPFGKTTQLEVLYLPQRVAADNGGALRFQTNVLGVDASLSAAKYVGDLVFGADFSGDLGPLGIHGEAAYTVALDGLGVSGAPVTVGEHFLRAVAGVDWRPKDSLVLMAEYHFNGYGAVSPSGYMPVLTSARASRGEVFGAGQHYLGLVAAWQPMELLSVNGLVLANLTDPSVMLVPTVEYWFEQHVIIRAGGFVPIGRWPDPTALRGLTPQDALTQSDAFTAATRSLGLKSEYGAGSFGGFVQVGLYTP